MAMKRPCSQRKVTRNSPEGVFNKDDDDFTATTMNSSISSLDSFLEGSGSRRNIFQRQGSTQNLCFSPESRRSLSQSEGSRRNLSQSQGSRRNLFQSTGSRRNLFLSPENTTGKGKLTIGSNFRKSLKKALSPKVRVEKEKSTRSPRKTMTTTAEEDEDTSAWQQDNMEYDVEDGDIEIPPEKLAILLCEELESMDL